MKTQEEFITLRDIKDLAITHRGPRTGDIVAQVATDGKNFALFRVLEAIGEGAYFCSYYGDRGGYHEQWVSIRLRLGDKIIGDLPGFEEVVPSIDLHDAKNRKAF